MKQLVLPRTSERIRGVILPADGKMYICDYDEVFELTLGETISAEVTALDTYELLAEHPLALGVVSSEPQLTANGNEISYHFDPMASSVGVRYSISGETGEIDFPILSGDWFFASFSPDGKYLVLAEPYECALYSI